MISVFEVISVLEMSSSVFRKAMATKTTPAKPSEMAAAEMTAATAEMTAAAAEMTAAAAADTNCPRTNGRERQCTEPNANC